MDALFEDNHLIAVKKPAGMLTQPTDLEKDSLETQVKEWIKARDKKPGAVYLHALFRLDRPVSGVVLFAKTSKALSRLNESVRKKETKKIYQAEVEGRPPEEKGTLKHFLIKEEFRARAVEPSTSGAKECTLHYRVLEEKESTTLIEIELLTGRYHQIRCQLAEVRCPIVGDEKYGSKSPHPSNAIALKHVLFEIPHPITKEWITFSL